MILHSKITQITPKRPQITPEVPKSMHWDIFSYWAPPKQFFFPVPLTSPNRGNPPILQMAFQSLLFASYVKKTYQWSQLGKTDPITNKDVPRSHQIMLSKSQAKLHCFLQLFNHFFPLAMSRKYLRVEDEKYVLDH